MPPLAALPCDLTFLLAIDSFEFNSDPNTIMGDCMRNDWRTFHIYDLEIGAKKEGASVPTAVEALAVWQKYKDIKKTYAINNDKAIMVVGDINHDYDNQVATIFIRISDKMAPNSVYSNPVEDEFSEHIKAENTGADFGCHVLLSLVQEVGHPNIYTCAIERVRGIPAGLIQRILSKFLNYEYKANSEFFNYPALNGALNQRGEPKMERCCPHIELRGRPSKTLVDDINNGLMSGVSLIKSEPVLPLAGAPYLVKEKSELKLAIERENMPAQVWESLQRVLKAHSGEYGQAKVSYRIPDSNRSVTVEFDSESCEPLSTIYVQAFEIGPIFPPLAQSSQHIVDRIKLPALEQFLLQRLI